jgi:hypothetical protein
MLSVLVASLFCRPTRARELGFVLKKSRPTVFAPGSPDRAKLNLDILAQGYVVLPANRQHRVIAQS